VWEVGGRRDRVGAVAYTAPMQTIPDLEGLTREQLVALVRELRAAVSALEREVAALRHGGPGGGVGPPKTPENSSMPPSQGWKRNRPAREPGSARLQRGPRHGHRGTSRVRATPEQVEVVLPCRPARCAGCGAALAAAPGRVVGRRQVVELPPPRPVVVEAERIAVRCPACGRRAVGRYPAGMAGARGFGPRLAATAAWLHEEHHVAYARMVEVFDRLFGLRISEGALVAAVARLGAAARPLAQAIGEQVRASPVVGSDETGARVDGETWWEWVFQTPTAAYHTIVRRRNTEVVLAFLDGHRPRVWISDLWKPQLAAPAARYQVCLAHQLRDLEYARQGGHGLAREWARATDAVLRWAVRLWRQRADAALAPDAVAAQVAAIGRATDRLLAQELPAGWSRDLQARFRAHRSGLLTCLDDPAVPPTNNASERSLRPGVVHRKVTGGFRSEAAAQGYAAIRTVADTARKRGQDAFAALLDAAGSLVPLTVAYACAPTTRLPP